MSAIRKGVSKTADVKWIKIATDVFDNRKIKQIEDLPDADTIIVIWFKLLCLAGVCNADGIVYFTPDIPYTDQMLAKQFNRPLKTIQLALNVFQQYRMIEIVDSFLCISSWSKYQSIDGLEKVREQNRIRQRNWYEKKKALLDSNVRPNVRLTQPNATDKELEKEEETEREQKEDTPSKEGVYVTKPPTKRFTQPTREEVQQYITEQGYHVDADRFVDYYTSNGWMVGKNHMKDWKAAVRTWERKEKKQREEKTNNIFLQMYEEQYGQTTNNDYPFGS